MKHIMFDLETLGTGSKAPIVQLAACLFDIDGNILSEFNRKVDLGNDLSKFEPTTGTIEFWLKQSDRARELVFGGERFSLARALTDFNVWINSIDGKKKYWSHATFDPPILMNAFQVMNIKAFIAYRDFVDIRTINLLAGEVVTYPREAYGEHHDAAADCRYQAAYVAAMMRKLK
jgi:hypothetical protein